MRGSNETCSASHMSWLVGNYNGPLRPSPYCLTVWWHVDLLLLWHLYSTEGLGWWQQAQPGPGGWGVTHREGNRHGNELAQHTGVTGGCTESCKELHFVQLSVLEAKQSIDWHFFKAFWIVIHLKMCIWWDWSIFFTYVSKFTWKSFQDFQIETQLRRNKKTRKSELQLSGCMHDNAACAWPCRKGVHTKQSCLLR